MKKRKMKTIKVKMLNSFLALLLIPTILLGGIVYKYHVDHLIDVNKHMLEGKVDMTLESLNVISEDLKAQNLTSKNAEEHIRTLLADGHLQNAGTDDTYIFILDPREGYIIEPSFKQKDGDNKDQMFQEMKELAKERGGFIHEGEKEPTIDVLRDEMIYTKADPNWRWIIGAHKSFQVIKEPAKNLAILLVGFIIGLLILGGIAGLLLFNKFSNRIGKVTEQMKLLADGDLSLQDLSISVRDETGQLSEAMNYLKWSVQGIISNVTNASNSLSDQSDELVNSAKDVKRDSEHITSTMQELASSLDVQSGNTQELAKDLDTFFSNIREINESSHHIQSSSASVLQMTDEGSELIGNSMEQLEKIDEIVQDAVQKVENLENQSQEIYQLVNFIQDIAEQTNLLALNASIEAARAGEHGRGFSVVAGEVGKLAEQVSNSIADITKIVENIQTETSSVTSSLQNGYTEVAEGTDQMKQTSLKFEEIFKAVTDVGENIDMTYQSMRDIAGVSEKMNDRIQAIVAVFEQAAHHIEETSNLSFQTTTAMDHVAKNAGDLAKLSHELNELVHYYQKS